MDINWAAKKWLMTGDAFSAELMEDKEQAEKIIVAKNALAVAEGREPSWKLYKITVEEA